MVFARSLHYQFYSWYAHQLPLLVWATPFGLLVRCVACLRRMAMLGGIEYAWNVFPSTRGSSLALMGAHAALIIGLWTSRRVRWDVVVG